MRIELHESIQGIGEAGEQVAVSTEAGRKFIAAGQARKVDFTGMPVANPLIPEPVIAVVPEPTPEPAPEPEPEPEPSPEEE